MRTPRLRSLAEFAEAEIVVPDGPRAGCRFRIDRHPVSRLLFNELDSGRWQRAFTTGPNQDGKSFLGFVIPTLYLLFERQETVIMAVPNLDLVADKWNVNLLPAICASRYKTELPRKGQGSRDGQSILYEFANGARLRFMTAGGNDQARAGFTSRNVVVTETEGFDKVGGSSREGDKFSQLERRVLAFGDQSRLIAECTVTTEQGRTWQEYSQGTRSRIALPCPHCNAWVTPEREHLVGWKDAETEIAAIEQAHIVCPACGAIWTNEQRIHANSRGVLVHRGQEVAADGAVIGDPPQTNTLGFRWTAVNSVLNARRLSLVGGIEWRAKRAADEDAAERDVCQSQWALPSKGDKLDVSQLDAFVIMRRTISRPRGVCPDGTLCVTVGCDIGKRLCSWVALAWRAQATPHVVDYGRLEVPSEIMAEEDAIRLALRDFKEQLGEGWKCGDRTIAPTFSFLDAGNWQDTILGFCIEQGPPFFAAKGYGIGQRREGNYRRQTGSKVMWSKDGYALVQLADGREYIEIKVDQWKSWLHMRLKIPLDQPGAMTLFESNEHLTYAKHLTAEKQVEEFIPREGSVVKWVALTRSNHYLDATMLACVAGYEAGMRSIEALPPPPPPRDRQRVRISNWLKN